MKKITKRLMAIVLCVAVLAGIAVFAATAVGSSSSFIVGFGAVFTGSCFTGVGFFAFFSSLSSRWIAAGFAGAAEAVFSTGFGEETGFAGAAFFGATSGFAETAGFSAALLSLMTNLSTVLWSITA